MVEDELVELDELLLELLDEETEVELVLELDEGFELAELDVEADGVLLQRDARGVV